MAFTILLKLQHEYILFINLKTGFAQKISSFIHF